MTERTRLRDELRRLGTAPVPVLDPVRSQRLERRVLGATLLRELELVDGEPVESRRPTRRIAAVLSLAAACLLAVAVIGSFDRTREPDRILSSSGEVEVVLPDGSVVDGSTGMMVPDGSILRLGHDGEAEVDGITISGAGDYLVTRDGLTLLTTPDPPASTPLPTARPPATRPPVSRPDEPSAVAAGSPADTAAPRSTEPDPATTVATPPTTTATTARGPATTVARPTTSQRLVPPPAASVVPRVTTLPSPPTTSVLETTAPPSRPAPPGNAPAPLDVAIRTDGRRVGFAWSAVAGAAGYVVAAGPAVPDGAGSWPPGPGVEITELDAGTLQHSVSRPTEGSWSYRVAAVGDDGRTLALSRVITIES